MRKLKKYDGERVILMACSKCNVNCKHCYIGYKGNRTPEELEQLCEYYNNRFKIVRIDGAEPLTDLGYLKSYKIVGQDWIMTNGLRIFKEPEVIDMLLENGITNVYMSYHFGIQNDLNPITAQMLDKVVDMLNSRGIRVVLMTTITNCNVNEVLEMCNRAYDMGAKGIEFNKIFMQGNAQELNKENYLDLYKQDYDNFFNQIHEARDKYNIDDLEVRRSGTFGYDTTSEIQKFKCSAGYRKVCLTPDNNVYGCTCICKPGYEIGKVIDKEIYLYEDFENDRKWCLGDKMGDLGIEDIQNLKGSPSKKLVREK